MDVVDVNALQSDIAYQEKELQELMQQVTRKESEISNLPLKISNLRLKEKMALNELGRLHVRVDKAKTKLDDCKKRIMDYDSDKIREQIED